MSKYKTDPINTTLSRGTYKADLNCVNADDLRGFPKDGISMSGEVTLNIGGPDQFVGYLGIDLASGESKTVLLVKKEIAKSFNINKGRFDK
ncbi:MAG TPA: hypothetical protein DHM90_05500 [Clostridiaceae bacterium]|nr:hypothetical protein [Clostridiaceae bacterium]